MSSILRLAAYAIVGLALVPAAAPFAQDDVIDFEGIRVFEPQYYTEFDPDSALQMVFRTPGFSPQESSGGRGLAGVRSNILINGERPPPKGQSIRQQLRDTPVAAVARIELIDAGARLDVDMQGYPQVVNVVTVENRPAYYEFSTEIQRTGTGDIRQQNMRETQLEALGSFAWQGHEFKLSADSRDRTNQPPAEPDDIDPANPEQRFRSPNRSEQDNYGVQLGAIFQLPRDGSLSVTSRFGANDSQSLPNLRDDGQSDLDGFVQTLSTSDSDNDQREFSAEYRRPLAVNGELMLAVVDTNATQSSASSFQQDELIRNQLGDTESGETATRLLVTNVPSERLTVRTTLTQAFNYSEGQRQFFQNGAELAVPGSDTRVEEDRQSVDTTIDWNLSDRWTFSADLGVEGYEIVSRESSSGYQVDPKGGFTVSFRPQPRTTMSFESSREIGQLSFNEFLASSNLSSEILTAGATGLEPVRRWNHRAIYDRRFGDVGLMRFELSRETRDNPIRQVALLGSSSAPVRVSQNTSAQTIDRLRGSVEIPFSRFNREDLILGIEGGVSSSDTIDPVTGEMREVSGNPSRSWNVQLRRDPRAGNLSWSLSAGRESQVDQYSVFQINGSRKSHQWDGSVEWEPIDGLKLRAELSGPRTESAYASLFETPRAIGLDPWFLSDTIVQWDRQASIRVEWRRWDHIEIRASLRTQPRVRTIQSLWSFDGAFEQLLTNEIRSAPRAWVRFRVYR